MDTSLESIILDVCALSGLKFDSACQIVRYMISNLPGVAAIDIARSIRSGILIGLDVTELEEESLKWIKKNNGKQTYPML